MLKTATIISLSNSEQKLFKKWKVITGNRKPLIELYMEVRIIEPTKIPKKKPVTMPIEKLNR
jgi:hypothetical protein